MNGVKRVWIYVFEVEFLSLLEIMSSVVISPPLGKNTGDDAKALHPLGAMEIGSIFWKTVRLATLTSLAMAQCSHSLWCPITPDSF